MVRSCLCVAPHCYHTLCLDTLVTVRDVLLPFATRCRRGVLNCVVGRPSVGRCAFECGVFELIVETLRTIGGPIEWLAFEKRSNGDKRVVWATQVAAAILRTELTQTYKADAQFQRSGLIQEFVGAVNALDALRRNKRNVEKLTINTANGSEMDDVGIRRWHQAMALSDDIERSHEELLSLVYSAVLYSILSVLSDHSHDGEVDKLLKVVQHAQEFASDAAFGTLHGTIPAAYCVFGTNQWLVVDEWRCVAQQASCSASTSRWFRSHAWNQNDRLQRPNQNLPRSKRDVAGTVIVEMWTRQ